jgi:hypothetical protein
MIQAVIAIATPRTATASQIIVALPAGTTSGNESDTIWWPGASVDGDKNMDRTRREISQIFPTIAAFGPSGASLRLERARSPAPAGSTA